MKVQCVICDQQSSLEDGSPLAKKLRNRPIHTYMCENCHDRIKANTEARHTSGSFQLYSYNTKENDF
ncbi:YlaI family protein [Lederbergia citrea]|uniref:YlaI family protein n=1 Tax=Lederbergia citrea TaxID=2833581 RepID=A0A942Z478_9BACI|nr:YlaI family protein [Lederbergia citrea]MBS4177261.1 YlaI family protein [Lederbergia citrea]MBS4203924.1 YlaI family protein [Lederbergia citrea]MBS4221491.1 YlaI family protein [Lederbergia citrea]